MPCHQNWVRCTVRTPRTQVAHTLRVQCLGRGRCCTHNKLVARVSRACRAHGQRRSRACWACAGSDKPRKPTPGRDLKTPGRDTKLTQPLPRPGRDAKYRSRPSWRLPYVATSISCCNLVSAHSGMSRS